MYLLTATNYLATVPELSISLVQIYGLQKNLSSFGYHMSTMCEQIQERLSEWIFMANVECY